MSTKTATAHIMKLRYKSPYDSRGWSQPCRVADYVKDLCDARSNEGGVAECAQDSAGLTAEALGRLVAILLERSILRLSDVANIVNSQDELEAQP
jgi:hypothetical protein